jgi:hypothetical protein
MLWPMMQPLHYLWLSIGPIACLFVLFSVVLVADWIARSRRDGSGHAPPPGQSAASEERHRDFAGAI